MGNRPFCASGYWAISAAAVAPHVFDDHLILKLACYANDD